MSKEMFEPENEDAMCDCGLPQDDHDAAPHQPFGENCAAAGFYRRADALINDAPAAFRGANITFSAAGWEGTMIEPEASEVELLAEQVAAACEERDGFLPLGPEVCETCGREPDCHIGGPILDRATDDMCEIGPWEDRAYALLRDLAAASVLCLRAMPAGYDLDSSENVHPDDVTLQLIIE